MTFGGDRHGGTGTPPGCKQGCQPVGEGSVYGEPESGTQKHPVHTQSWPDNTSQHQEHAVENALKVTGNPHARIGIKRDGKTSYETGKKENETQLHQPQRVRPCGLLGVFMAVSIIRPKMNPAVSILCDAASVYLRFPLS